jgi:Integrase core domain
VGSSAEVLFDRVCAENGIRQLLTAPRSPTITGKVERWPKTIRAEFLAEHDYTHGTTGRAAAGLGSWVAYYNAKRPHQALGMRPPLERFHIAAAKLDPAVEAVLEPALVPAGQPVVKPSALQRAAGALRRGARGVAAEVSPCFVTAPDVHPDAARAARALATEVGIGGGQGRLLPCMSRVVGSTKGRHTYRRICTAEE